MDKRSFIGIVLILLILLLMPYYQRWISGYRPLPPPTSGVDTTRVTATDTTVTQKLQQAAPAESLAAAPKEIPTPMAEGLATGIRQDSIPRTIEIENEVLKARLSNQNGGNPVAWELKHYAYFEGGNVNLIDGNGLDVEFTNKDGKRIHLNDFRLFLDGGLPTKIILDEQHPTATIRFYLPIGEGRIVKTYTFHYRSYSAQVVIRFESLHDYIINRRYGLGWVNGLPSTEENMRDDFSYARAFAYMAGELENLDVKSEEGKETEFNGRVDWVAVRNKYFLAALIPNAPDKATGALLAGKAMKMDGYQKKTYHCYIDMPYSPEQSVEDTFQVYLGPLDYDVLKKYEVDLQTLVMNRDWYERLFRPISLVILPAFKLLHHVIPNYGFVIIVFSILIKILLHPLTKKSYQSMSEMQYIQPLIAEIREKYKNDPQRMNKEMMRIYKEHGINPLGGCLPTLLQMPLLFALFIVFRSTIQLRGQPFILWITDLSRPDKLHLGVHLPLFGDNIHVLPIIMALTMIWQSKMSVTDPKQKYMIYFMPLFMLFIFYSLPSGLNLYYTVFNFLSMLQTNWIKKRMHPEGKLAKAGAAPAKRSRQMVKASRKKS